MIKKDIKAAHWLVCVLLAADVWTMPLHAAAASITVEQWSSPRSGQSVLAMEPVAATVKTLLEVRNSHLLLSYPPGEEGSIWAAELRGWLVSLGIASERIQTLAGDAETKVLGLEVVTDVVTDQEGNTNNEEVAEP